MPPLFDLHSLSLHLGGKTLFEDISHPFTDQHKTALIGRNGTGKSTLCRVIIGTETADSGEVVRHAALRLGFLRQDDNFLPEDTVIGYLQRDSGAPEWRCAELAYKFALGADMAGAPISELSGGWRMRVKLVALLLHDPNFLILDEPTNFLDLRTQLLLQRFLVGFRGGALVVSHDRAFLDATCDHTLELTRGALVFSPLRVSAHLEKQRERAEHDRRANASKEAKMRQLQSFIDKNRAGANTASQARSKQKQLDRIELAEIEGAESCARIRLPQVEPARKTVLTCSDLAIGYEGKSIATRINFSVEPGEHLVLCGDNGQGKTTLLKTLTGALPPTGGRTAWSYGCSAGVYAQHVYLALPQEITVREYLQSCNRAGLNDKQIMNLAGGFLFAGDEVNKLVKVLSGGERARLCLAGLFLSGNNVLVLDEPSNHLDVETAAALAEALNEYRGAVLFVSHERTFAARVATGVLEINRGRVRRVNGGFADYLTELEAENAAFDVAARKSTAARPEVPAPAAASPAAPRLSGKERFEKEKRVTVIERKLDKLETKIEEKVALLHETAHDWAKAAELGHEVDALRAEKDALEEEWLAISAELAE